MGEKKICRGILTAYFVIMTVVYPLYAPGGYLRIGEVKYYFFRNVTLVMIAAAGAVVAATALMRRDREWVVRNYRRMSVTDWFAYGYCLTAMVSYLCSSYKEDALWGAEGWYMGVMSQVMFVLLYFLFSRFFCQDPGRPFAAAAWAPAAAMVFLLGICDRYSLYLIEMEGRTETFISTLGNINWFCGYWSVMAPAGIMLYWCGRTLTARILWGAFSFLAMLSGVTQGSSSAYVVFLVLLFVVPALSLKDGRKLRRFTELCLLFAVACQTGRVLRSLPGLSYNYGDFRPGEEAGIAGLLLDSDLTAGACLLLAALNLLLWGLEKRGGFSLKKYRRWRGAVPAAAAVAVCVGFLVCCAGDAKAGMQERPFTREADGYLKVFPDEDWGNGRGGTWNCGVNACRSMDILHKMVGIGPDCFADYIYDRPELAERMADQFANLRLTNAHNEWLTVLVNTGVLGLLCYAGMFVSSFVRLLRRASAQPYLYVCAVVLFTYTAHNMVSFQQVLHTPYAFMVLGIGEGLIRTTGAREDNGEIAGE